MHIMIFHCLTNSFQSQNGVIYAFCYPFCCTFINLINYNKNNLPLEKMEH